MISTRASTVVEFGSADRVELHLRNWGDWMRSGGEVRGAPSRSQVLSCGGHSQEFDDMVRASDRQTARVVDMLVTSLGHPRRSAIDAKYLGANFQYQTDSFAALLDEARGRVGRGLAVRGVW